jgi:hypothetical protein
MDIFGTLHNHSLFTTIKRYTHLRLFTMDFAIFRDGIRLVFTQISIDPTGSVAYPRP